jgi:hypothetical protein
MPRVFLQLGASESPVFCHDFNNFLQFFAIPLNLMAI